MTNMPYTYDEEINQSSSKVYYREGPMSRDPPIQLVSSHPPIQSISSHQPVACICPYCHQSIVTRIERRNGILVWLASAGICFLGLALGCCLIPFFVDGIKDTEHYCPICNRMIGRKKRL